ncbi:hypothetical protein FQA39_LY17308 [Lamprigera yunnana]|nr:hypothetical protein FQA39_LY17308 [Lamprigera yunnana]
MHILSYIIIELASSIVIGATVSMSDTERKCIPLPLPSSHSDEVAHHPVIKTPTAKPSKPRNRRSIVVASVSKEKDARVQKLHQATEQQKLLFNLQKQILELQRVVEERAAAKKKAELKFDKPQQSVDWLF